MLGVTRSRWWIWVVLVLLTLFLARWLMASEESFRTIYYLYFVSLVIIAGYMTFRLNGSFPLKPLAVFIIAFIAYLTLPRTLCPGDTIPTQLIPFSLLREGNFDLNEFGDLPSKGPLYFFVNVNGRTVSGYPPAMGVLVCPLYAPFILAGVPPDSTWLPRLQKWFSSFLSALVVALWFIVFKQWSSEKLAPWLTVVFGLASPFVTTGPHCLWTHTGFLLGLALILIMIHSNKNSSAFVRPLLVGVVFSATLAIRPQTLLIMAPVGFAYLSRKGVKHAVIFSLGGFLIGGLQLLYNTVYHGDPLLFTIAPGLVDARHPFEKFHHRGPVNYGQVLYGVLLSPSRGLLIYFPLIVFSFISIWKTIRKPYRRAFLFSILFHFMLIMRWPGWYGGHSIGPRLFVDCIALALILLGDVLPSIKESRWRTVFMTAFMLSVTVQSIGLFYMPVRGWSGIPISVDIVKERLFSWRDSPPAAFYRFFIGDMQKISESVDNIFHPLFHSFKGRITSPARELSVAVEVTEMHPRPVVFQGEIVRIVLRATNQGSAPIFIRPSLNIIRTVIIPANRKRAFKDYRFARISPINHLAGGESRQRVLYHHAPSMPGLYHGFLVLSPESPNDGFQIRSKPFVLYVTRKWKIPITNSGLPEGLQVKILRRLWFPSTRECLHLETTQNMEVSILLEDPEGIYYRLERGGLRRLIQPNDIFLIRFPLKNGRIACPHAFSHRPAVLPVAMNVWVVVKVGTKMWAEPKGKVVVYPP